MDLEDAIVVLHLEFEIEDGNRGLLLDFCKRAFPIYESNDGNEMALYEDRSMPNHFVEVGYYESEEDYERCAAAIESDSVQNALIREWRGLMKAPPKVTVFRRLF